MKAIPFPLKTSGLSQTVSGSIRVLGAPFFIRGRSFDVFDGDVLRTSVSNSSDAWFELDNSYANCNIYCHGPAEVQGPYGIGLPISILFSSTTEYAYGKGQFNSPTYSSKYYQGLRTSFRLAQPAPGINTGVQFGVGPSALTKLVPVKSMACEEALPMSSITGVYNDRNVNSPANAQEMKCIHDLNAFATGPFISSIELTIFILDRPQLVQPCFFYGRAGVAPSAQNTMAASDVELAVLFPPGWYYQPGAGTAVNDERIMTFGVNEMIYGAYFLENYTLANKSGPYFGLYVPKDSVNVFNMRVGGILGLTPYAHNDAGTVPAVNK